MTMSELSHFVYQPVGVLRRYVREMLWVRSDGPRVQILLPETTLTLALRQSGSAMLDEKNLPCAILSGLQERTRTVEHAANSSMMIVRFTEVGAAAILRERVDLLYKRTVSLDSMMPRREIDEIQDVLADASEIREKMVAVERFLTDRICVGGESSSWGISPQIEAAVKMIRRSEGRSSIAAVARHVALSQSTLERQFRAAVGATPKGLSRLARLQHVCRLWDTGKNLTTIAFEAGYSDQPHMVHDFRLFTGASPEGFFRTAAPRNLPTFYK
jgi:AraC-like DNA-binding protein